MRRRAIDGMGWDAGGILAVLVRPAGTDFKDREEWSWNITRAPCLLIASVLGGLSSQTYHNKQPITIQ